MLFSVLTLVVFGHLQFFEVASYTLPDASIQMNNLSPSIQRSSRVIRQIGFTDAGSYRYDPLWFENRRIDDPSVRMNSENQHHVDIVARNSYSMERPWSGVYRRGSQVPQATWSLMQGRIYDRNSAPTYPYGYRYGGK